MFNFLKNKKNNLQKLLIKNVERVRWRSENTHTYSISTRLNKIINRIDNNDVTITRNQFDTINKCIESIEKHLDPSFESLLLDRCTYIDKVLDSELISDDVQSMIDNNDDKLFTQLKEMNDIDKEVSVLDGELSKLLGVNKEKWLYVNNKKNMLLCKKKMIFVNYNALLNAQNSLSLAKDSSDLKEDAIGIYESTQLADSLDFDSNSNIIVNASNEATEQSDKMKEMFDARFGFDNSGYVYEKALEDKLLSEQNSKKKDGKKLRETN